MQIGDKNFPNDFVPSQVADRSGPRYRYPGEPERPMVVVDQRHLIPRDDHPVARAYREILQHADLATPDGRKLYLSWVALAIPMDDWGILENAAKIQASVQELNRMYDLEKFISRLEDAERRVKALQSEFSDDARSQQDALAHARSVAITEDVQ